jgi:fluoride ion exporter CrcB/FEX
MVIMMDGTGTKLGSQICSAIFGYMIGVSCSLSSFNFGRNVAEWMKRIHPVSTDDTVVVGVLPTTIIEQQHGSQSKLDTYNKHDKKRQIQKRWNIKTVLEYCNRLYCVNYGGQIIAILFLITFLINDFVYGIELYRTVWLSLILSPFGSILRWRLSHLNTYGIRNYNMQWFPIGTFLCNVFAAGVSISVAAIQYKIVHNQNNGTTTTTSTNNIWNIAILSAISTGLSGSTSTVSTLMREMADANTPFHAFIYCFTTIVSSVVVGLLLYRPIAG